MSGGRVIALGFFDGVHLGHGALLSRTGEIAAAKGLRASALTFSEHPSKALTGKSIPLLNTTEDRAGLMRRLYGINEVIFLPFDGEFSRTPWDVFVSDILVARFGAEALVAGYDHRFGYGGAGDPARLLSECERLGLGCSIIQPVRLRGTVVSSTHVRSLVAHGDMAEALRFLGHPHVLSGPVLHGRKLGRTLGFPTINLRFPEDVQPPRFGVYLTEVALQGMRYRGVTNVGTRPTLDAGDAIWVETLILDFSKNVYGETVRLEFLKFLRPERHFDSVEALTEQIRSDVAVAKSSGL